MPTASGAAKRIAAIITTTVGEQPLTAVVRGTTVRARHAVRVQARR